MVGGDLAELCIPRPRRQALHIVATPTPAGLANKLRASAGGRRLMKGVDLEIRLLCLARHRHEGDTRLSETQSPPGARRPLPRLPTRQPAFTHPSRCLVHQSYVRSRWIGRSAGPLKSPRRGRLVSLHPTHASWPFFGREPCRVRGFEPDLAFQLACRHHRALYCYLERPRPV